MYAIIFNTQCDLALIFFDTHPDRFSKDIRQIIREIFWFKACKANIRRFINNGSVTGIIGASIIICVSIIDYYLTRIYSTGIETVLRYSASAEITSLRTTRQLNYTFIIAILVVQTNNVNNRQWINMKNKKQGSFRELAI